MVVNHVVGALGRRLPRLRRGRRRLDRRRLGRRRLDRRRLDATSSIDAGSIDAGGVDAGSIDAGGVDAGSIDAGSIDAGSIDAGSIDAGSIDAGSIDAGGSNSSIDAGGVDAGSIDAGSIDAEGFDEDFAGRSGRRRRDRGDRIGKQTAPTMGVRWIISSMSRPSVRRLDPSPTTSTSRSQASSNGIEPGSVVGDFRDDDAVALRIEDSGEFLDGGLGFGWDDPRAVDDHHRLTRDRGANGRQLRRDHHDCAAASERRHRNQAERSERWVTEFVPQRLEPWSRPVDGSGTYSTTVRREAGLDGVQGTSSRPGSRLTSSRNPSGSIVTPPPRAASVPNGTGVAPTIASSAFYRSATARACRDCHDRVKRRRQIRYTRITTRRRTGRRVRPSCVRPRPERAALRLVPPS